MAHIPDGVLAAPVLLAGAAVAVAGLAVGLRRAGEADIPRVAMLTAAFFVASLVAIPAGPTSVHPLLAGLMGLVVGWGVVPAVFAGLVLQALFFGFGGLTTLGVNTVTIALPGLVAGLALGGVVRRLDASAAAVVAGIAGALAAAATGGLIALALAVSSAEFAPAVPVIVAAFVPLVLGEAAVTASAVLFLKRVRPDFLAASARAT